MPHRHVCRNPLSLLSPAEIERIHDASLTILSEVGVKFEDAATLRELAEFGCAVDFEKQVARFAPGLVMAALASQPASFRLRARDPEKDIVFAPGNVHFSAGSGMDVYDAATRQRRPGTSADSAEIARLCDALETIAGANPGLGWLSDKPHENNLEWSYAIALRNSRKVTSVGVMEDSELWGIRMAQAVGCDIIVTVNSASPLGWTADQLRGARRALDAGLPLGLQSMASPGITAPATLAGAAAVMNAEILAMATYVQLRKPGTGLMYSCFALPIDMKTTMLASGSMEYGMMTVLSAQLSRHYGMGSIIYSPMTDTRLPDQQAGYEKGMQWLLAGMAGINLVWGAGMIEGHSLWSHAQLLIDAEMAGMVGRYLAGAPLSSETLALDVIRAVGHFPGNYLETDHTFDWWRQARYLPLVSSRESREQWEAQGEKDVLLRADEQARALLAGHEPAPLPAEVDRELDALLEAAAASKTQSRA